MRRWFKYTPGAWALGVAVEVLPEYIGFFLDVGPVTVGLYRERE